MKRFTDAVEASLRSGNYYSALFLSLALPDICARLESENDKTNGEKYAAWFDKYMSRWYTVDMPRGRGKFEFLSGDDCYVLRCSMLHEGLSQIAHQKKRKVLDSFHFTCTNSHGNRIGNVLQLDVPTFCNHICQGVKDWIMDFEANHLGKADRLKELVVIHVGQHDMGNGIFLG